MARAQIIVLHGHQLSAAHHYAVALIMQRCNELRHFCDTLDAALQAKHARLLQTHQLLLCLRQVATAAQLIGWFVGQLFAVSCLLIDTQAQTWCDDGAYLLANQLVDKLQSKEEAQAALRDIERFLEGAPSTLNSGTDVLAMEYEAVITPQLQVGTKTNFTMPFFGPFWASTFRPQATVRSASVNTRLYQKIVV